MKNKGLKIGDRIKEGSRFGKVVAFHTKGTVDVLFDGEDYAIRRQLPNVFKANPDIERIQYQAQVQGIYESQVRDLLGVPYNTPFEDKRGNRLDEDLTKKERREILSGAFAIATSVGRRDGYLHRSPDRSEPYPVKPTKKGVKRIIERISHPEDLRDDQEDYEKTLKLARKNPMQLRRNAENPVGITHTEMKAILNTEVGMYEMDNYIRWENFPRARNLPKGFIKEQLMPALYLRASTRNLKGSGALRMTPRPLYGSSAKTTKSDGSAVEIRVVYLQPAKQSDVPMPKSGQKDYAKDFADMAECAGMYPPVQVLKRNGNTCAFFGECAKFCLVGSGRLGKEDSEFSAWCKTWLFFHYPLTYIRQLLKETAKEASRSKKYGLEFYARLNGTSDIPWERYIDMDRFVEDTPNFGGFYDYTKYPWKARQKAGKWIGGQQPKHYDITFSISEKEEVTGKDALGDGYEWLANGGRVAVVVDQWLRYPYDETPKGKSKGERGKHKVKGYFEGKLTFRDHAIHDYSTLQAGAINAPDYSADWQSEIKKGDFPLIIDGDETDFRFADPPYSIIILKPKGIRVREDGHYYTDKSVYRPTLAKRKLSKKSKAFIKSEDYVLELQDQILEFLGHNGEEKVAAKNPREPSTVKVVSEDGYFWIVKDNRAISIRNQVKWITISSLKRSLRHEGYKLIRQNNTYYVMPV